MCGSGCCRNDKRMVWRCLAMGTNKCERLGEQGYQWLSIQFPLVFVVREYMYKKDKL